VTYDDSRLTPDEEASLALLHEENGVLVDRTVSLDVDANVLCADVRSFSRFGIGVPLDHVTKLRASMRIDKSQVGYDEIKRVSGTLILDSGRVIDPMTSGVMLRLLVTVIPS